MQGSANYALQLAGALLSIYDKGLVFCNFMGSIPFGVPSFCLSISRLKIISLFILFRLAVLGQLMPFANDSLSRVIPFTMPGPPKPPAVHVTDVNDREVRITISQ